MQKHRNIVIAVLAFLPSYGYSADKNLSVTVHGTPTDANAPLQELAPTHSSSSTKSSTPIVQIPQSINVIGSPQLKTIGASSLISAVRYTPGVSIGNNDSDVWESVYIRGFKARRGFKDGMRYQVDAFDGKQEVYNIEKMEVSKGATSLTFGGNTAGGAINNISKRPTEEPFGEVGIKLGSFGKKEIFADTSDNLNEDGTIKYRIVTTLKDKDSYIDHVDSQRGFIAPSITWHASENTELTVLAEIQKDEATPLEESFPRDAYFNDHNLSNFKKIDRSVFLGEPGIDKYKSQKTSVGYELNHNLDNGYSVTSKARYLYVKPELTWTRREGLTGTNYNILERERVGINTRTSKLFTTDNFINMAFGRGDITHNTLIGFDFSTDEAKSLSKQTELINGNLDIHNPVYGNATLGATEIRDNSRTEKRTQAGVYAQNQTEWNNFTLTVGGRYGSYKFDNKYLLASRQDEDINETVKAFTGRAGLTYEFDNGIAPFIGFSQSFDYNEGGQDRFGNRFKPLRGEQIEVGTRYQPHNDILLSAAAYELVRKNVTSVDEVDPQFRAQTGEITSKGFELEAQAKVTDDLKLLASYAKTKARITKDHRNGSAGEPRARRAHIPENQFSLWTEYALNQFSLPNLTLGLGVRRVGEVKRADATQNIPSYTVVDASVGYTYNQWGFDLDLENLSDDDAISCAYECAYGTPRSATASVKYTFK